MKYTVMERRPAVRVSLVKFGAVLQEVLNQRHITSLHAGTHG